KAMLALVLPIFLVTKAPFIIELFSQHREAFMNHQEVRAYLSSLDARRPLAVDSAASRYIYDYRLPPQAVSWEFRYPPIGEGAGHPLDAKPEGMILVIQRNNPFLGTEKPTIFFGVTFRHIAQDRTEIMVVVPDASSAQAGQCNSGPISRY